MRNDDRLPISWHQFALVAAAALVQAACGQGDADTSDARRVETLKTRLEVPSNNDVMVVAHRTCWQDTAENSIAGIERCKELGVDMIEIDVRETSDGELVLMHDDTIDRTTSGSGLLAEMTTDEVRSLKLKTSAGGENADWTSERVPTLREALTASKGHMLVNLDIKETLYDEALSIAKITGTQDQILIKMRAPADDPALANAAFHGQAYFMPIIRECTDDPERACTESLSEAIPDYVKYDPIAIEAVNHTDEYLLDGIPVARELGLRVWVNTLGPRFAAGRSDEKSLTDPDNNWGYLIQHGVNMIQTDRPQELIQYLEARGARESAH